MDEVVRISQSDNRTPEEQFALWMWVQAISWATFLGSLRQVDSRDRDDETAAWSECSIPSEWRNPGDFMQSMTKAMSTDLFRFAFECNPQINLPDSDEEKKIGLISVS